MFRKSVILWSLMLISLFATGQENNIVIPTITVEPLDNNMVSISGQCTNNTLQSKELKYLLSVQKKGRSGNTNNNNQSGNFYIDSEESKKLSTTTINFEPLGDTEIVLTIFNANNVQIAQHKKLLTEADLIKY